MSSSNVAVDDRILDAAARCLQLTGRVPIAEVARQSGVSRPTVYRRFADSDAVVRALWERELGRLVEATPRRGADRSALVAQIVRIADGISTDETLMSTFVSDRSLIAEYIVDRLGSGQRALLGMLRGAIADGQRAGTVRRGRPNELAAMVLLVAQSAIQSRQMIAEYLPATAWRRELTRALDGYLAP